MPEKNRKGFFRKTKETSARLGRIFAPLFRWEVLGLLGVFFGLLLLISLVTYDRADNEKLSQFSFWALFHPKEVLTANKAGILGAWLAYNFYLQTGFFAFVVGTFALAAGSQLFLKKNWNRLYLKVLPVVVFYALFTVIVDTVLHQEVYEFDGTPSFGGHFSFGIAAFLSALKKKVLVVDFDPQANTTSGFGINLHKGGKSIYDVIIGKAEARESVKKTELCGVHLIPSVSALAGAAVELVDMQNREYKLKEAITPLWREYDFILIDSPPSVGLLALNALIASARVIIPVQCEYYALEGLAELLRTIQLINTNLKTRIGVMGALLTMYDQKSRLHRAVAKDIKRKFPGYVFKAVIPKNIRLAEAPSFGKTILHYAPYSHGAKAYRQFAEEILTLGGM